MSRFRIVRDQIGAGEHYARWLQAGGAGRLAAIRADFERDPRHGREAVYEVRHTPAGTPFRVFVGFRDVPGCADAGGVT